MGCRPPARYGRQFFPKARHRLPSGETPDAAYCENRSDMGKISCLEFSNGCLNYTSGPEPARSFTDGYFPSDQARSEGRQFPAGISRARGYFHAGGSYGLPEINRADGGRVCAEGSAAAGKGPGKQETGPDGGAGAQGGGD